MEVYELLSVGLVILLGILGGKLSHRFKIPRVTGYMLIGLIFGPSILNLLTSETLADIHMINDIALGLILFAIGGEFEWRHIKSMGRRVILTSIAESFAAFLLVSGVVYLLSGQLDLALLLGCLSMATAPGVTLLVIREYRARGQLTDTLLVVVALNNVLALIVFRLFLSGYDLFQGAPWLDVAFTLFKELGVSVALGGAIGAMITYWEQKIDDLSELLLVIVAGLLLGIGLARTFGLSYLMVCLIIGAVTNNLSMMHRLVYAELRQTEMPFYIAFFVLSGASLRLESLPHLGLIGLAYLITRPMGKALGAYLAGRKTGSPDVVNHNLGLALIPQAGVAIGMVLTAVESYPELGRIVSTVVLSSVIVYEGVGPFLTRLALNRAGEIHLQE